MPNKHSFDTVIQFLTCLGSNIEKKGTKISAKLHVAGEVISTFFYYQQSNARNALIEAVKRIESDRKAEPSGSYWLITESPAETEHREWIAATGIRVATVHEYLNTVFKSAEVSQKLVSEADSYIPESRYVDQRVEGSELKASVFVRNWIDEGESSLLVVLAQAGHGKTCLAHHLGRGLAREHLREASQPIPFYIPLHRHRHVREFEELVLTNLEDRGILGLTSQALAYLVNIGKVLPILDGFDELAETGGIQTARRTLAGLLKQLRSGARCILTSRHAFFRHRADVNLGVPASDGDQSLQTAALEPFGPEERALFWQKIGVPVGRIEHIEGIATQLGADEEFLGSPLILSILEEATREGDLSGMETGPRLLHGCLIRICEREAKRQPTLLPPTRQIEAMSTLADLMLENNSYVLEEAEAWLRDIVGPDIPAGLGEAQREDTLDAMVRQLKDHAFVRIVNGSHRDALSFLHPLYRDYLVALKVADFARDTEAILPYLRKSLPDITIRFLAEMLALPAIAKICYASPHLRSEQKNFFRLVLRACDRASMVEREVRTDVFLRALGGLRNFMYADFSGLTIRVLTLNGFDFSGADLRDTAFQNCRLLNCEFGGALFNGARLFACTADEATAEKLISFGIQNVGIEAEPGLQERLISNEDPIKFLLTKFFKRFIRKQRGMHQRTVALQSFDGGLGHEERRFTETEIFPLLRRFGVISIETVKGSAHVVAFDPSWQSDGDALIWDGIISERLRPICEELRKAAQRYTLT